MANWFNVQIMTLSSDLDSVTGEPVTLKGQRVTSLDIDIANDTVCWISYEKDFFGTPKYAFMCAKMGDSAVTWELDIPYRCVCLYNYNVTV